MRGGAQAHLLEADDGNWYVVKFRNNPQHRRILVNELIASVFLQYLKISSPEAALININESFLDANPKVHLTLGTRTVAVEPGWHFGSRFPGDPARTAVYDFLPDALLSGVANLEDFRAVLVFDKWTGNADGRQSVFYRALVRSASAPEGRAGFVARMIDQGFAFNGPHWTFTESAVQGLYARRVVYEGVCGLEAFQPWLDQIIHFPEEVIDQALKSIPLEWIEGDEDDLDRLLEELLRRRQRVPELIQSCRHLKNGPFPNWQ
jgi:hypothetical protein